jgi:hypothetical protein
MDRLTSGATIFGTPTQGELMKDFGEITEMMVLLEIKCMLL